MLIKTQLKLHDFKFYNHNMIYNLIFYDSDIVENLYNVFNINHY